jgi:hypothetical protein
MRVDSAVEPTKCVSRPGLEREPTTCYSPSIDAQPQLARPEADLIRLGRVARQTINRFEEIRCWQTRRCIGRHCGR